MGKQSEELVLQVTATQELLERQLREMGRNVDTFEQAAESRLTQLEQRFSGINLRGAVDAVRDADKAFRASFDGINRQAAELADTLGRTGQVDLSPLIAQSRARAQSLDLEATVLRKLTQAEEARQAALSAVTVQEQAALAAGRAAVVAAEQRALAATNEVQRLQALQGQLGQVTTAHLRAAGASDAQRFAMVNIGNQFGDFFVQVSGGTSALRAFSQQAPQLIGALQLMGAGAEQGRGKFAALAGFLADPWGIALSVAIAAIPAFINLLDLSGDAAERTKPKIDRLATAYQNLLVSMNKAAPDAIQALGDAKVKLTVDKASLEKAKTELAAAEKLGALQEANKTGSGPYAVGMLGTTFTRIQNARERVRALQQDVQTGEAAITLAESRIKEKQAASAQSAGGGGSGSRGAGSKAASPTPDTPDSLRAKATDAAAIAYQSNTALRELGEARGQFANEGLFAPIIAADIDQAKDDLAAFAQKNKLATDQLKTAWADGAQGVIGALQQMKGAFQSGDFLDQLSAVLNLFGQVSSTGLLGKSLQNAFGGARASGGPVSGGVPYLVGEKGPELFVPNGSGSIVANDNLRAPRLSPSDYSNAGGGKLQIEIMMDNDMFTARVRGEAAAVAAPIGPAAAQGGAVLALDRSARAGRRRIPSRF